MQSSDLSAVRPWLPHWWRDADVEPERVWELPTRWSADTVIGELELWIAEHAVDRVFVHAAVVAFDGRALLLPGRSFSGKTTLTAALLRAGAVYGSDEYAVLDADGRVHPYPRPLSIRSATDRARVPASDFGATTFLAPLPVAAVADLRYAPDARFEVQTISAGTAVLRLFDNTVCARTRAQPALDALIAAVAGARAVSGTRGEAEDAAIQLKALITGRS